MPKRACATEPDPGKPVGLDGDHRFEIRYVRGGEVVASAELTDYGPPLEELPSDEAKDFVREVVLGLAADLLEQLERRQAAPRTPSWRFRAPRPSSP